MTEKEGLVKAIRRLATDEEFRQRLLIAPREVLMEELGISRETYEALVALVPVLLAGGLFVLSGGIPAGTDGVNGPTWGGWGRG